MMTPEQKAKLGELAVLIGTADDMARQARAAIGEPSAATYTTARARIAIRAAHDNLGIAASELLRVLDTLRPDDNPDERLFLAAIDGEDGDL